MPTHSGRPAALRALRLALLSAGLLACLAAAPARAGEPRFHLSWHRPWGEPGALATVDATCADSTRRDTLWLSFEPTQDESTFTGIMCEVYVYAQPGDTLGTFWDVGHGAVNNGGMVAQFGVDDSYPGPSPWAMQGGGAATYDRTRASGRFRFGCVLPPARGTPLVGGTRYVVGRVIVRGMHGGLTGCEQPVCIEWRRGEFLFGASRDIVVQHPGVAMVTRGPAAAACRDRVPGWRPPGAETPFNVEEGAPRGGHH